LKAQLVKTTAQLNPATGEEIGRIQADGLVATWSELRRSPLPVRSACLGVRLDQAHQLLSVDHGVTAALPRGFVYPEDSRGYGHRLSAKDCPGFIFEIHCLPYTSD
jgi:hypothetical protein